MYLEKICVIADPMTFLTRDDADLLYDNVDNYEDAWRTIKAKHNVETNRNAKDIHLFDNLVIPFNGEKPVDNIPDELHTQSGFLVGIELKDIKKFNPNITASNLENAFVINCVHMGISMDEDSMGEFVSGKISFINENYQPSDENSHQYITYDIEWENPKEAIED